MRKRITFRLVTFLLLVAFVVSIGGMAMLGGTKDAYAGLEVVGNSSGQTHRAIVDQGGYKRIVYFPVAAYTMAGANTPVASSTFCGLGAEEVFSAQVQFTGTMAGTAPTLTILWQNSVDGGTTWTSVGTWTTINATVTPATQNQTVSEVYNNTTAVAYGDCWRATYSEGGTGTVVANFSMYGLAE